MIDNNHELTIGELDAVNGGLFKEIAAKIIEIVKSPGTPSQGGQNDPAQMFQQVLQQLTQ